MKRSKQHLMKPTARVYLNELNPDKTVVVKNFIYFCHDVMQYYVPESAIAFDNFLFLIIPAIFKSSMTISLWFLASRVVNL